MSAGREDLARAALERKQLIAQEVGSFDQPVSELESQQEKLTTAEEQLQAKVEQFRSKKEVIKAQYSAAEAQVHISEAATGVGDEMADVGAAMQRAIDKTGVREAQGRGRRRRPAIRAPSRRARHGREAGGGSERAQPVATRR
jgi:phage shock protein A